MIVYNDKFKKLVSLAETTMYCKDDLPKTYYIARYLDFEEKDGFINLIVTDTQNSLEHLRINNIKFQYLSKELVGETNDGRQVVKNSPVYQGYLFAKINHLHDDNYVDGVEVTIYVYACREVDSKANNNKWQITLRYQNDNSFYNNSMDCAVLASNVALEDGFDLYTPESFCPDCYQLNTDCESSSCNHEAKKRDNAIWSNLGHQSVPSDTRAEEKQRQKDTEDYLNDGNAEFFRRRDEDAIDRAFRGDDN